MKLLNGFRPESMASEGVSTNFAKHKNHSESVGPLLSPEVGHFNGTSAGSPDMLIDRKAPVRKSDWELANINTNNGRPRLSVPDDEEERPIVKLNKK